MATTKSSYKAYDSIDPNVENHDFYDDSTFDSFDEHPIPMMHQYVGTTAVDGAATDPPVSTTGNDTGKNGGNQIKPKTPPTKKKWEKMPKLQSADGGAIEKQPAPTGKLAWLGFGCCVFALMCLTISFCSPYWIQTWPMSLNEFKNMGLWEVCFNDYMHFKDDSQQVYSGCWWVFDDEPKYYKLREWLIPPWFITCQVLVSGCLVIEIVTAFMTGLIFLHCCPIINHEYLQTYGMFASGSFMFLVTMISFVVGVLFGVQVNDRYWMPRPDQNYLSWGFGFLIISGIFTTFSGICLFVAAWDTYNKLLKKEDDYTKLALEMSMYQMDQATRPLIEPDDPENVDGRPSYPKVVPMGFVSERPPSYTQPSYSHTSYAPVNSEDTHPFSGRTSEVKETSYCTASAVAAAAATSADWPLLQPSSTSFEPESTVNVHPDTSVFAKSYEQSGRLAQMGKSYEKSYERRYSDTSFDDPQLDPFDPKPERQY